MRFCFPWFYVENANDQNKKVTKLIEPSSGLIFKECDTKGINFNNFVLLFQNANFMCRLRCECCKEFDKEIFISAWVCRVILCLLFTTTVSIHSFILFFCFLFFCCSSEIYILSRWSSIGFSQWEMSSNCYSLVTGIILPLLIIALCVRCSIFDATMIL